MSNLYWSIRREVWENRSLYLAPLIVAAVVLFTTSISTLILVKRLRTGAAPATVTAPFSMAPAPIMFTTFVVAFF